jgi:hypothetical protein
MKLDSASVLTPASAVVFVLLLGCPLHAFPWLPRPAQTSGSPAAPTDSQSEDLFTGKAFVSEASNEGFNFWIFNPGKSVKKGWVPLRYSMAIWMIPGNPKAPQTQGYDEGSEFAYEVDAAAKTIAFRQADGQVKSYNYSFINPNHVTLSNVEEEFPLYAVPARPEMFFRSKAFSPDFDTMDPDSEEHAKYRLAMLNEFIGAAKNGAPFPEIPVIAKTEPRTNTKVVAAPAPASETNASLNGEYKGTFVNELNETTREFELKIGSQGDPSGQPPSAAILATLRFDDGRGDDGLQGVATYGQNTSFTLGWKNSTGSMTFDGKLEGDKLSGTWRLEGANEETGRGTFEGTRSGS